MACSCGPLDVLCRGLITSSNLQLVSITPLEPESPLGLGYVEKLSYDTEWGTE
jgi:hypothetical protein